MPCVCGNKYNMDIVQTIISCFILSRLWPAHSNATQKKYCFNIFNIYQPNFLFQISRKLHCYVLLSIIYSQPRNVFATLLLWYYYLSVFVCLKTLNTYLFHWQFEEAVILYSLDVEYVIKMQGTARLTIPIVLKKEHLKYVENHTWNNTPLE